MQPSLQQHVNILTALIRGSLILTLMSSSSEVSMPSLGVSSAATLSWSILEGGHSCWGHGNGHVKTITRPLRHPHITYVLQWRLSEIPCKPTWEWMWRPSQCHFNIPTSLTMKTPCNIHKDMNTSKPPQRYFNVPTSLMSYNEDTVNFHTNLHMDTNMSKSSQCLVFLGAFFSTLFSFWGKFGLPYLVKAQQLQKQCYPLLRVCVVFSLCLNNGTAASVGRFFGSVRRCYACNCTRGLYRHLKRVCTGGWL